MSSWQEEIIEDKALFPLDLLPPGQKINYVVYATTKTGPAKIVCSADFFEVPLLDSVNEEDKKELVALAEKDTDEWDGFEIIKNNKRVGLAVFPSRQPGNIRW